ncbi:MAG: hypothetical protein QGG36_19485 [Pirellulaceae bacterium]|nr:hypothetical protein [Pirellulaceae bacterium]
MDSLIPAADLARHSERSHELSAQLAQLNARQRHFAVLRVVTFLIAAAAVVFTWTQLDHSIVGYVAAGLVFAGFLAVVAADEGVQEQIAETTQRRRYVDELAARAGRCWSEISEVEVEPPVGEAGCVAQDLDLFGHASVFQWLCQARTPLGIARLRRWLLEPAGEIEIRRRQAAVQTLAQLESWREQLAVRGRMLHRCLTGPNAFLDWVGGAPLSAGQRNVILFSRVSPVILTVAGLLWVLGAVPPAVGGWTMLTCMVANIAVSVFCTGAIHDVFFRISTQGGEMQHYRALFGLLADLPPDDGLVGDLRRVATQDDRGAEAQLRSLGRLVQLSNLRRAGLFLIVYLVVQILFMWDSHVLALMEKWRLRNQQKAPQWFAALGDIEALASLAAAARDAGGWCYPEITADAAHIEVSAIGHPLLPDDERVGNDVAVGEDGSFLLVSGSNMSGKSTLLRSLGVNTALAQSGAPVCATRFRGPPLSIQTSMRIQDSLEDGVSFFMAELKRLKAIVDRSAGFPDDDGRRCLYLLDEILQGTNSVERRIAVSRVIGRLLENGALGAVSTHDLGLADEPVLKSQCRNVHFREHFIDENGQRRMAFDYRLQPGVATTTNALALLKLVGLETAEDGE